MKVVFLDFDGVLNSERYVRSCGYYGVVIDPTRLALLRQIIAATQAKIVLSTSWREHWDKEKSDAVGEEINRIFENEGMRIFSKTPTLRSGREEEIRQWLLQNGETEEFVVLDDAFLSAEFLDGHFVRTSNLRKGLEEDDVKKAIEILNGGV